MPPVSTTRSLSRSRARLRVLVLLLALLVPGAHAAVHTAPVVSSEAAEAAGYDALDTALRPPSRAGHRPAVPLRPAPAPGRPAPAVPEARPLPEPPGPSYALHSLRSVVLRC